MERCWKALYHRQGGFVDAVVSATALMTAISLLSICTRAWTFTVNRMNIKATVPGLLETRLTYMRDKIQAPSKLAFLLQYDTLSDTQNPFNPTLRVDFSDKAKFTSIFGLGNPADGSTELIEDDVTYAGRKFQVIYEITTSNPNCIMGCSLSTIEFVRIRATARLKGESRIVGEKIVVITL